MQPAAQSDLEDEMKKGTHTPARIAAAFLASCALVGCGSSGDGDGSAGGDIQIPALASGAYVIVAETGGQSLVGKYYADSGSSAAMLMLLDDDSRFSAIYTKGLDGPRWRTAGSAATANTPVIKHSAPISAQALDGSAFAGIYEIYLRGNGNAQIRIDSSGAITSTATSCKLQGQLGQTPLPQLLKLNITQSNCSGLSGAWSGFLVRDSDDMPASFRFVSTDGGSLKDAWGYAK